MPYTELIDALSKRLVCITMQDEHKKFGTLNLNLMIHEGQNDKQADYLAHFFSVPENIVHKVLNRDQLKYWNHEHNRIEALFLDAVKEWN